MIDLKKHGLTKSDYGKIKATGGFNTEEYYDDAATEILVNCSLMIKE